MLNYQNLNNIINDKRYSKHINDGDEVYEQSLISKYLPEDSIVLELGARTGAVSRCINSKLNIKEHQVSVEPNEDFKNELFKLSNTYKFKVFIGAISNVPLYLNNIEKNKNKPPRYYITSPKKDGPLVNSLTYDEVCEKYNLKFNAIVADCEGALPIIFEENPKLYDEITYLQLEWDWDKNSCDKFRNKLINKGFKPIAQYDHWKPSRMGPRLNIGHEVFIK